MDHYQSRKRDREQKRLRYRTDPAFRARIAATEKKRQERLKKDKLYQKLRKYTKLVWERRESIRSYYDKIDKLDRDLARFIKIRDKIRELRRVRGQRNICD